MAPSHTRVRPGPHIQWFISNPESIDSKRIRFIVLSLSASIFCAWCLHFPTASHLSPGRWLYCPFPCGRKGCMYDTDVPILYAMSSEWINRNLMKSTRFSVHDSTNVSIFRLEILCIQFICFRATKKHTSNRVSIFALSYRWTLKTKSALAKIKMFCYWGTVQYE